jgi:hypothetical protein
VQDGLQNPVKYSEQQQKEEKEDPMKLVILCLHYPWHKTQKQCNEANSEGISHLK